MVLKFWIWSLRRDLASCSEYPSFWAKLSNVRLALRFLLTTGRKHTSLEFEFTAKDVHQKLDHGIHWCQSIRKQEESNHDRLFLEETERLVQGLVVDENREECKDVEHVGLA